MNERLRPVRRHARPLRPGARALRRGRRVLRAAGSRRRSPRGHGQAARHGPRRKGHRPVGMQAPQRFAATRRSRLRDSCSRALRACLQELSAHRREPLPQLVRQRHRADCRAPRALRESRRARGRLPTPPRHERGAARRGRDRRPVVPQAQRSKYEDPRSLRCRSRACSTVRRARRSERAASARRRPRPRSRRQPRIQMQAPRHSRVAHRSGSLRPSSRQACGRARRPVRKARGPVRGVPRVARRNP